MRLLHYPDIGNDTSCAGYSRRVGKEKTAMAFFAGKNTGVAVLLLLSALIGGGPVAHAQSRAVPDTLTRIKRNGYVTCGVTGELLGFSHRTESGEWQGFDIDYCRAIAAAVFDDPSKIQIREINAGSRKEEIEKRRVDVIVARTSASMSRETRDGLVMPAITYFDGQGILLSKAMEISSVQELAGKTVCVQKATVKADNIAEFFRSRKIFVKLISLSSGKETFERYEQGECEAVSADMGTLYSWRIMSRHPDDYTFLPDIIAKDPTGPIVPGGERNWVAVIRWIHMAMVNAEELSVNRRNVDDERNSPDLAVRRLLGMEGDIGNNIGLDDAWAYRIIRHVGNYGEVFERNLGASSQLKVKRGQNALWSEGGLQYGIPIR